ncbi:PssD/Cps14F family polysaccharide biosynthesis glycosyltransferase [Thiopseudomonas alkaliphila]|nr:PssD/Cps14F family polysaccharide biosynthesis glycosyltransferase [Thiopseudomonas alkaliphila]
MKCVLKKNNIKDQKVFMISSGGGHLNELYKIIDILDGYQIFLITEKTKINTSKNLRKVMYLPKGGRENIFLFSLKFILNIILSFYRMCRYKPDCVISTGAHTAVPSIILARLLRVKTVYIESYARVREPSLTGRLVYAYVDIFYVQWPEMILHYPKARYIGALY